MLYSGWTDAVFFRSPATTHQLVG